MPTRARIAEELDYLSDLISNRVRAIAAGVLAISWALLIEGRGPDADALVPAHQLSGPIVLAIAALVADVAQYGFGLLLNLRMYHVMRKQNLNELAYDRRHALYRLRQWMFPTKVVLCAAATGWLLLLLAGAVRA